MLVTISQYSYLEGEYIVFQTTKRIGDRRHVYGKAYDRRIELGLAYENFKLNAEKAFKELEA